MNLQRSMSKMMLKFFLALFVSVLACATGYADALPDTVGDQLTAQVVSAGGGGVTLDLNIQIPITDNPAGPDTNLWATAIFHTDPVDGSDSIKRPTIVVATAYRRELMLIGYLLPFIANDYNVMAIDMRGTGSAEGVWGAMDPTEQYDLAYIIDEWIPAQSWSDGKIGMVGGSYMAILQYSVSGLLETEYNPATGQTELTHLKAIAPLSTLSDTYRDIAVHGGNFEMEFMTVWIAATDLLSVLPPDLFLGGHSAPGINLEDIEYAADIWAQHFSQLQVPIDWIMDPDNSLKNSWYNNKSPYIYWPEKPEGGWGFEPEYPPAIGTSTIPSTLPVFNTGGWFDIFTRGTLNNYQYGLANHAATDKALVIGPWYHHDAAMMCPGINGIGIGGEGLINNDILIRWFDWKIKGEDDPFMEEFPVVTYVMGDERWRAEKSWPLPETRIENQSYYLSKAKPAWIFGDLFSAMNHSNNYKLVNEIKGSDYYDYFLWFKWAKANPKLQHDPPLFHGLNSRSAQRWLGFSPLTMISQLSRYTLNINLDPLMPWEDERLDELGVLTFTTKALSEDVEIAGPLKLTFWAKTVFNRPLSQEKVDEAIAQIKDHFDIGDNENHLVELADKRDVQWVIEVNDVFPNGRARNITSGWLSAWHRPYDPADPTELDPAYVPFDPFYDHPGKNPQPIEEEIIYPYVVEVWPTNNTFKKGHRIRVSISASDVPHLFPVFRPSKNTIVIDNDHQARLDFKAVNKADEGTTWKWIDDVSDYLNTHNN
jgi:predicted acyl esterase